MAKPCIYLCALGNAGQFWLCILVLIGLLWSTGARELQAQQLQELDVAQQEAVNELPLVLTEFPNSAYLVFDSSIPDLRFESNWIIRSNLSEPNSGRYILVVDTVRQVLRVSSPSNYRARDIFIPRLQNRQTVYYSVEPVSMTRLAEIRRLYEEGAYQQAVTALNAFVLIDGLTVAQRANAYQLIALCYYELSQQSQMTQALGRMLAIDPFRTPDIVGTPAIVQEYIEQYQDSVRSQPPAVPESLEAALINNNVLLSWTPNTDVDLAHYRVYRKSPEEEGTWEVLAEPTTVIYLDESVVPFDAYAYRVSAVDDYVPAQESRPSATVEITVLPSLAARSEVRLADNSPIKNVSLHQPSDSLLALSYTLQGGIQRTYNVSFAVSDDNGQTFTILPETATGDVGNGVSDGLRRQIIWQVLQDYPEGLLQRQYVIAMHAEPLPLSNQISLEVAPDSLVEFYSVRSENDSLITISYRLQDLDKTRYTVDLAIEQQQGQFELLYPEVLEGSVGSKIKGGRDHTIQWHILETYPEGLSEEINVQLRVEASRRTRPPWYMTTTAAVLVGGASFLLFRPAKEDPPVADGPIGRPN